MNQPIVRRQEEDTFFIHNCFGSFFSGVLDWFSDEFYPRFEYKVIGTYDKAVQHMLDRKKMGTDPNEKLLPAISLDPMLDFSNEERGGRFLWQHKTLAPGIGMRLFKSIDLKEQDIIVSPVFSRYQGNFEITFWLESVYELIDFRVALLQFCGGFQRWIRPKFFWSYLILPEKVENYEKEDGSKIDWSNTYASIIHVDTINKHRLAIPIALDPIWRLESFGDSSTKYGGDQIAEYKLSATFGYEVNIPTYTVLSRGIDPKLKLSFSIGRTFSKYPLVSPFKILKGMENDPLASKYISANFKLFTFKDKELERSSLITKFSANTVSFPDSIPSWNYIVIGNLIEITKEWLSDPQNVVHKDDIIYFDKYIPEFLPAMRKCLAVISRRDAVSSDCYQKCSLLKKSFLGYLSNDEVHIVKDNVGKTITLDTLNKAMYLGILEVVKADENDPVAGYNTINQVKQDHPDLYKKALKTAEDQEPINFIPEHQGGPEYSDVLFKRLLKDKCDGHQTRFYLDFILDKAYSANLLVYVDKNMMRIDQDYKFTDDVLIEFFEPPPRDSSVYIGGHLITLRESKLVAIYEFTEADEAILDPIIVVIPEAVDRKEDVILVSYTGRLEYEKDYTIADDGKTFSILLKPLKDEIIEFFYYV